jgi:hypothetical protein
MVVARAVIPKLNTIMLRENLTPVVFKNKQLIIASSEARIIAASPPKSRNVRNITESEKLNEKFERGIFRLSLGATVRVKTVNKIKPQLKLFQSNLKNAKANDKLPRTMTAALKNVKTFTRFI